MVSGVSVGLDLSLWRCMVVVRCYGNELQRVSTEFERGIFNTVQRIRMSGKANTVAIT